MNIYKPLVFCLGILIQQSASAQTINGHKNFQASVSNEALNTKRVDPVNPAKSARKVMAVIYQNCKALLVDPLPLTFALAGIRPDSRENQVHAQVPSVRFKEIHDLKSFVTSHPYISSATPQAECLDLRTKPPVYDFGGVPLAENENTLNLHKNSGTGSQEMLGIDCSAFVATSLLASGLKLSTSPLDLSARQFDEFDSGQFLRAPIGNDLAPKGRMECLEPVSIGPGQHIQAGDVIGWKGHVVMVDEVGADPLGIDKIKTLEACEKLSLSDLNFTMIQSSGAHEGVGVVRSHAKEILATRYPQIGAEFLKMATEVCRAKFANKALPIQFKSSVLNLTRHRNLIAGRFTSECATKKIELAHSDCVAACIDK